jgi:hypothetical protein
VKEFIFYSSGHISRALVNTVVNLRVPYNARKFLSSYTTGYLSRTAQLHEDSWLDIFELTPVAARQGSEKEFHVTLNSVAETVCEV